MSWTHRHAFAGVRLACTLVGPTTASLWMRVKTKYIAMYEPHLRAKLHVLSPQILYVSVRSIGITTIADNAIMWIIRFLVYIDSYLGFGATRGHYALTKNQKWWNRNHSPNMKDPNSTTQSIIHWEVISILISIKNRYLNSYWAASGIRYWNENEFYYSALIQVTISTSYEFLIPSYRVHNTPYRSSRANFSISKRKWSTPGKRNICYQFKPTPSLLSGNRFSFIFYCTTASRWVLAMNFRWNSSAKNCQNGERLWQQI